MNWPRSGLALFFLFVILAGPAVGATPESSPLGQTYYVRPDGGSYQECSGLVDAAYPGSGTAQPCAWNHPFRALEPSGEPGVVGLRRIAGGDTLIIAAGSYRMGYGAPGADHCESDYPWECIMPPVPSGPDAGNPTRILGAGWDVGCADPPELWGTERANTVLDLSGSSHVEIACLEISDHVGCVDGHSGGLACDRDSFPYGDWAARGIYAEDSSDVTLRDLDIHGLSDAGVQAGRLSDWTVIDVRIAANGWVGWDGDINGADSNSGLLRFSGWTVEWNGCVESWPEQQPTGCWAQTAGGYGDGVGTGETGGHWIIEDSAFLHNTSDGLDLLYARVPGSLIEIRRTLAEGNAGNQIKASGPVTVENSILVGNCGFFDGADFTYHVDNCRAYGSTLPLFLRPGNQVSLFNNTISGEGDCLLTAECDGACSGAETVWSRNNILLGHPDFLQAGDRACLTWSDGFPASPFDFDFSLIDGVKNAPCPGPHAICGQDPKLAGGAIDAFDAHPAAGSPAVDYGLSGAGPLDDFDGAARDSSPDLGAYELRAWADVDGDGLVGLADVQAAAAAWGCAGPYACPRRYDLDGDRDVDVVDVQRVTAAWPLSSPS